MFKLFKKNKPKVSLVIIIYNKEDYIEECLDSIVSQNIDKEIICVDDCSTDRTNEILKSYAKKYSEIKIVRNYENCGTILSRYNGLKKCTGEYAYLVDGDDKLMPDTLATLYDIAVERKCDILEFSMIASSKKSFELRKFGEYHGNLLEYFADKKIKNTLANKLISEKVYKKTIPLLNPDVKHDNFAEAIFYSYHFLSNASSLSQVDIKGYYYYDDRGMTTNSNNIERLKHFCNFYITYNELCCVYGESKELFYWKNIVCNQAIDIFLKLNKKDQDKYRFELKKLMTEEEIDFLINEKLNGEE